MMAGSSPPGDGGPAERLPAFVFLAQGLWRQRAARRRNRHLPGLPPLFRRRPSRGGPLSAQGFAALPWGIIWAMGLCWGAEPKPADAGGEPQGARSAHRGLATAGHLSRSTPPSPGRSAEGHPRPAATPSGPLTSRLAPASLSDDTTASATRSVAGGRTPDPDLAWPLLRGRLSPAGSATAVPPVWAGFWLRPPAGNIAAFRPPGPAQGLISNRAGAAFRPVSPVPGSPLPEGADPMPVPGADAPQPAGRPHAARVLPAAGSGFARPGQTPAAIGPGRLTQAPATPADSRRSARAAIDPTVFADDHGMPYAAPVQGAGEAPPRDGHAPPTLPRRHPATSPVAGAGLAAIAASLQSRVLRELDAVKHDVALIRRQAPAAPAPEPAITDAAARKMLARMRVILQEDRFRSGRLR